MLLAQNLTDRVSQGTSYTAMRAASLRELRRKKIHETSDLKTFSKKREFTAQEMLDDCETDS